MPAAASKKQPKSKEHVKGLETDEALDQILTQYTEKRSQHILNDASIFVKEPPKTELGSRTVRRARRKELQAKSGMAQPQEGQQVDENQDICLKCGNFSCRLMHWLMPNSYPDGVFTCALCNNSGTAQAGVWHCFECNQDAHVSCYSRKKEALELAEKMQNIPLPVAEADCPKPSLAWDPLSLTGPHKAIGAGAGVRSVGEVALD